MFVCLTVCTVLHGRVTAHYVSVYENIRWVRLSVPSFHPTVYFGIHIRLSVLLHKSNDKSIRRLATTAHHYIVLCLCSPFLCLSIVLSMYCIKATTNFFKLVFLVHASLLSLGTCVFFGLVLSKRNGKQAQVYALLQMEYLQMINWSHIEIEIFFLLFKHYVNIMCFAFAVWHTEDCKNPNSVKSHGCNLYAIFPQVVRQKHLPILRTVEAMALQFIHYSPLYFHFPLSIIRIHLITVKITAV